MTDKNRGDRDFKRKYENMEPKRRKALAVAGRHPLLHRSRRHFGSGFTTCKTKLRIPVAYGFCILSVSLVFMYPVITLFTRIQSHMCSRIPKSLSSDQTQQTG